MSEPQDRIAVTGVGAICALGHDAPATFSALVEGRRGIREVDLFDVSDQRGRLAGQVQGLRVGDVAPPPELEFWSRGDALAVLAAEEAWRSAGLAECRYGLVVGGTVGGMFEAEQVVHELGARDLDARAARRILSYPLPTAAERIAGAVGRPSKLASVCSACSSGANAVVLGAGWLLTGLADVVLVGGCDALCRLTLSGFNALGAVDVEPCRPFDESRRGLNLGEGAAFLVLEREQHAARRGAVPRALLCGWAVAAEAHHITHPEPSGRTAARLMSQALERARLSPQGLDYVNAHGTGTPHNDVTEALAISQCLGAETGRVFVSSSKAQIGHTLGAAGALEALICVLALEHGVVPPTVGLVAPLPEHPLRHVPETAVRAPLRTAMSNSFGFGGTGTVLLFERSDAEPRAVRAVEAASVVVSAAAVLTGAELRLGAECSSLEPANVHPHSNWLSQLDPGRSRRFDEATAMVTLGAERTLEAAGLAAAEVGLVAGNAHGQTERAVAFLRRIDERGARMASPADFPHLVPSAPAGNASVYTGLTGPVLTVSDRATSVEQAFFCGRTLLDLGLAPALLVGGAEPLDSSVRLTPSPHFNNARNDESGAAWFLIERAESAAARNAPPLARLLAALEFAEPSAGALASLPVPGNGASLVVHAANLSELNACLDASSWASVERRSLVSVVGDHEASGGMALAVAVGMLAEGKLEQALFVGHRSGQSYVLLLGRS